MLIDRGTAFLRLARLDEAEAAFRVAFELSETPQALDGLGCVAYRRGNFAVAIKLFRRAFEADRSYVTPLANLARLYDDAGEGELAQKLYAYVLAATPSDVAARNNQSALFFDIGDRENAREALLMAQAVNDTEVVRANLKRWIPLNESITVEHKP
jgi:tetratricopeptide (TPR) repeat protein